MIRGKSIKLFIVFCIFVGGLFAANELLTNLQQRASENLLYEKLEKIKTINQYINQYIMHYGKAPTKSELIDYCQIMKATDINDAWWPTSYDDTDGTKKITFAIDTNNSTIIYTNIFTIYPSATVKELFVKNINILPDSIILDSRGNPSMSLMPSLQVSFDAETSQFQAKINQILASISPIPLIGRDLSCNLARAGYTWYEPNGMGGFLIRYCNSTAGFAWETVSNLEENDIKNNAEIVNNSLFYEGQTLYKDKNGSSEKIIFVDENKNYEKVYR